MKTGLLNASEPDPEIPVPVPTPEELRRARYKNLDKVDTAAKAVLSGLPTAVTAYKNKLKGE